MEDSSTDFRPPDELLAVTAPVHDEHRLHRLPARHDQVVKAGYVLAVANQATGHHVFVIDADAGQPVLERRIRKSDPCPE